VTEGALSGRLAIITGGGRGIGEAIALQFAKAGACLALAARTRAELDQVARQCRAEGAQVSTHLVDVSVREQVDELMTAVGRADVLVNCAGT
jgi:NAD(P)-dependent dehydrogenase (short-subunit alcohol dehydrogenase family)